MPPKSAPKPSIRKRLQATADQLEDVELPRIPKSTLEAISVLSQNYQELERQCQLQKTEIAELRSQKRMYEQRLDTSVLVPVHIFSREREALFTLRKRVQKALDILQQAHNAKTESSCRAALHNLQRLLSPDILQYTQDSTQQEQQA
jgi:DUF438 domain-containing protein